MTQAEIAAEKVRKAKEKMARQDAQAKARRLEQRQAVALAEAAVREEDRKRVHKRRYHVGALVDEAGLFAWSNADLGAVFAVLSILVDAPNPAGVLIGALCAADGAPGLPVDMAAPVYDGVRAVP